MFEPNDYPETQPPRFRTKVLTPRRIKIITSFLCMTINNPSTYGKFESPMWIDMLIELLCEPKRCKSSRADIKAWLKNDRFEELIERVHHETRKLRLSSTTFRSESPYPSSSASSPEFGAPMDLSMGGFSPGISEGSDETYDIYTPNLLPLDYVEMGMDVVNEELEPQEEQVCLDLSFPRSKAVLGNDDDMAASQNQSELEVGLPEKSSGQQHGDKPIYPMQGASWNPSSIIENWLTLDAAVKASVEAQSDYDFKVPFAIAPWLFTKQNVLLDSMELEEEAFVGAIQTACAVPMKTKVESDDESEYLDISYTRAATRVSQAVNMERFKVPRYQSNEGFNWQMPMEVRSPQSNHELQGDDQEEALDYSVKKITTVPSEDIPIMPMTPLSLKYEDKSTQTLPVSNEQLSRPLNGNMSAELLDNCNKALTGMVEDMQHLEDFTDGWDVVYRALSLVQATMKTRQE